MRTPCVRIDDVEVVDRNPAGMSCRVGRCIVWVGNEQREPGSTVRVPGDRGRLVLKRELAQNFGLLGTPRTERPARAVAAAARDDVSVVSL